MSLLLLFHGQEDPYLYGPADPSVYEQQASDQTGQFVYVSGGQPSDPAPSEYRQRITPEPDTLYLVGPTRYTTE